MSLVVLITHSTLPFSVKRWGLQCAPPTLYDKLSPTHCSTLGNKHNTFKGHFTSFCIDRDLHEPMTLLGDWWFHALLVAMMSSLVAVAAANNVSCVNNSNNDLRYAPLNIDNCPLLSIVLDTPDVDWTFTRCNITSIAINGTNMTNVRLRFIECYFGCIWKIVPNATVHNVVVFFSGCAVQYNLATALTAPEGDVGYYFFGMPKPGALDDFSFVVEDTSVTLPRSAPTLGLRNVFCDSGFLRIHLHFDAPAVKNLSIALVGSRFVFPMKDGTGFSPRPYYNGDCSSAIRVLHVESDVIVGQDPVMPLHFLNMTVLGCSATLEGSSVSSLVYFGGFIVDNGTVVVAHALAEMNLSTFVVDTTNIRDATFLSLSQSRFLSGSIRVMNCGLHVSIVAGNTVVGIGRLPTTMQSTHTIFVSLAATDVTVAVHNSNVDVVVSPGYFSAVTSSIDSIGVGVHQVCNNTSIDVVNVSISTRSAVGANWSVFCPYKRTVNFKGVMSIDFGSLGLTLTSCVVTFLPPANVMLVSISNSLVSFDVPDVLSICPRAPTAGTINGVSPFTSVFSVHRFVAVLFSDSPAALYDFVNRLFHGVSPVVLSIVFAASVNDNNVSEHATVLGLRCNISGTRLHSPSVALQRNDTLGMIHIGGCTIVNSTFVVEQTQLFSPSLSIQDAAMKDCSVAVYQSTAQDTTHWLSGPSTRVACVYLSNVSLGVGNMTITSFKNAMALQHVANLSGGIVELGLQPLDISSAQWAFDSITVITTRHSPFALFSSLYTTTHAPFELRSVAATCVLWNGRFDAIPLGSAVDTLTWQSIIASNPSVSGCRIPLARPSATITLETLTFPGDKVGVAATYVSSASSAAVAFVAVLTDVTASLDMQAAAVIGLSACASGGVRSLGSGPMVYLLSPFADLGALWSAGGNFLIMVAFGILHTMAMCVVRRRQPASRKDWAAAGVSTQFPNLTFALCLFLMNGTSCFGMILAVSHPSVWAAVVGVWCVLWCAAVIAAAVLVVRKQRPNLRFEKYRLATITACSQCTVPRFLLPIGRWSPPVQRRTIGRLVGSVRSSWELFGIAPMYTAALVFNVIASLPASGSSGCVAQWCVLASIPMCLIVFMMRYQPTRVVFVAYITSVSNLLLVAMCVISALSSGKALDDDKVATAIEVVSILLSVTNGVRSAHTVFVMYMEHAVLNTATRRLSVKEPKPLLSRHRFDEVSTSHLPSSTKFAVDSRQLALSNLINMICTATR